MLHTVVFTAQVFHDTFIGPSCGRTAEFHLAKTLAILQQSLNDGTEATSNETMAVVTSLAMAAFILGDIETARKHMDGLSRMVTLRGGFKALGKGALIEHKARR